MIAIIYIDVSHQKTTAFWCINQKVYRHGEFNKEANIRRFRVVPNSAIPEINNSSPFYTGEGMPVSLFIGFLCTMSLIAQSLR